MAKKMKTAKPKKNPKGSVTKSGKSAKGGTTESEAIKSDFSRAMNKGIKKKTGK